VQDLFDEKILYGGMYSAKSFEWGKVNEPILVLPASI
jgi:hypothetical protein